MALSNISDLETDGRTYLIGVFAFSALTEWNQKNKTYKLTLSHLPCRMKSESVMMQTISPAWFKSIDLAYMFNNMNICNRWCAYQCIRVICEYSS